MICAAFNGLSVEEVYIDAETKNSKEYKAKNPAGKFPCLETEDGMLFESSAIAKHFGRVGDKKMNGADAWAEAQSNQWIDYAQSAMSPHTYTAMKAHFGWAPIEKSDYADAIKAMKDTIRLLNTNLEGKKFLTGDSVSTADIVVGVRLSLPFQTCLDAGFRKSIPHVAAWMETFLALPEVVARLGHMKMCSKSLVPICTDKKKEAEEKAKAEKAAALKAE
jgi:glutathione S-transferase